QGTTVQYSSNRFRSHIHRFDLLAKMLDGLEAGLPGDRTRSTRDGLELLIEIESRDNIFSEIDFRVYCS
ncbi:MAG: 1,4-alpha-glucan branching protein domain-containing protein, partial [Pyrinomonadaceae bacterium]